MNFNKNIDYSKIFETFLRKWIMEDINSKININQFAGRKGTGTDHLIVMMVDRVQQLLDKPQLELLRLVAALAEARPPASPFAVLLL